MKCRTVTSDRGVSMKLLDSTAAYTAQPFPQGLPKNTSVAVLKSSSAKSSFRYYTEVQRKQCLGNGDTDFSSIKLWQGRLLSCLIQQKLNKSWLLFVPQAGQSCCGLSQSLNTSPSHLVTGSHTSRMPTMTQLTLR